MLLVGGWLFPATMKISIKVSQDLETKYHLIYYVCAWSNVSQHTTQAPAHQYLLEHSWKYPNCGINLDVHPPLNEKGECGNVCSGVLFKLKEEPERNSLWKGRFIWVHGIRDFSLSEEAIWVRQWEHFAEAVHRANGQEAEGTENQRLCYNLQSYIVLTIPVLTR